MRVVRGRTFEKDGVWDKLEVELDQNDLLPAEKSARAQVQPLLLEVRAEQQLIAFLSRAGQISLSEASEASAALKKQRENLLRQQETRDGRLIT